MLNLNSCVFVEPSLSAIAESVTVIVSPAEEAAPIVIVSPLANVPEAPSDVLYVPFVPFFSVSVISFVAVENFVVPLEVFAFSEQEPAL